MTEWISVEDYYPGDKFNLCRARENNFVVVYHHGDGVLFMDIALWSGENFKVGSGCFCDCKCDCGWGRDVIVTHWSYLSLPTTDMDIYE